MAGEYVPLVLFPRHTTLAGLTVNGDFTTGAMDVTPYSRAVVTTWRGKIVGPAPSDSNPATPAFLVWFEESTDQMTWTLCAGSPNGGDPGTVAGTTPDFRYEAGQTQYPVSLTKRWFRLRVRLFAAANVASCWAVGFLERRVA